MTTITFGQIKRELESMGARDVKYTNTGLQFSSNGLNTYYLDLETEGLILRYSYNKSSMLFGHSWENAKRHIKRIFE